MTCTVRKSLLRDKDDLERIILSNKDKLDKIFLDDFSDISINEVITSAVSHNNYNNLFTVEYDTEIIAFIHFYSYNHQRGNIYFSYILDRQYQRKGLIKNICKDLLIQYLKYEHINKIFILIDSKNVASIKFAEKLSFKRVYNLLSILSLITYKRSLNLYYLSKRDLLTFKT